MHGVVAGATGGGGVFSEILSPWSAPGAPKANGGSNNLAGCGHEKKEFRMEKPKFGLPRMKKRGRTETFCVNVLERSGTQGYRRFSGYDRVGT
jgi:hypothetical protein